MKLIKINPENPETAKIEMAREILRQGGTIVYPTDTVYGLAANIFHEKAVLKSLSDEKKAKKQTYFCLLVTNTRYQNSGAIGS